MIQPVTGAVRADHVRTSPSRTPVNPSEKSRPLKIDIHSPSHNLSHLVSHKQRDVDLRISCTSTSLISFSLYCVVSRVLQPTVDAQLLLTAIFFQVIIDGKGHLLGRLASIVAKQLLNGQKVVVVRCEALNISGEFFRAKCTLNPNRKSTRSARKDTNWDRRIGIRRERTPGKAIVG
jgi:hypothetical protein